MWRSVCTYSIQPVSGVFAESFGPSANIQIVSHSTQSNVANQMYQIYQSRLEPSHWASGVVNVSTSDQFHQVSLVSLVKIPAPPGSQNFNLYGQIWNNVTWSTLVAKLWNQVNLVSLVSLVKIVKMASPWSPNLKLMFVAPSGGKIFN